MVRYQRNENNHDPKLEDRFSAFRRKQINQASGRNIFQPNVSNESNFHNLHYQQVTVLDRLEKPKTMWAWVDQTN